MYKINAAIKHVFMGVERRKWNYMHNPVDHDQQMWRKVVGYDIASLMMTFKPSLKPLYDVLAKEKRVIWRACPHCPMIC